MDRQPRKSKYKNLLDGDSFEIKNKETFRLACCDCGLVHLVCGASDGKRIGIAMKRDKRATAQRRRWSK